VKRLFCVLLLSAVVAILGSGHLAFADNPNPPFIAAQQDQPALLAGQGGSALLLLAQQSSQGTAAEDAAEDDEYEDEDEYDDDEEYGEDVQLIPDPWYEMNYGLWVFNDRLYFWLLKPVSQAYGFVIPVEIRGAIRNMFYNIRFPIRFINCLLQGKIRKSGYEFGNFFVNTTWGFLGMADVAQNYPHLDTSPEDLGQTFAVWGIGSGAYLMVPFFGPHSLRHGIGRLGDTFLDPIWWLVEDLWVSLAIRGYEAVNDTSLRIGDYEALKEASLDPYVAIRNAYVQNRNKLIEE
jgi:phospholipid-binding lipoprotein MlaA